MLKVVIFLVFCSLAGSVYSQSPMQLLVSIESPFESDTNSWGGNVKGNGDINGDGYNDIVLAGQPLGSGNGRRDVYIYLGGSLVNTAPDYIIPDPASSTGYYSSFGSSIAYNGDLNGDGYCDLVISEPQYGYDHWGRVLAYYGGPDFDIIPDIEWNGQDYGIITFNTCFGRNINTTGDFNGDGYADLVVNSAHLNEMHFGQINVFYGGPGIDTISDWQYTGEVGEAFGNPLSVGDINGDGFSDLVTFSSIIEGYSNRAIRVFLGGSEFNNQADYSYQVQPPTEVADLIMDSDFDRDGFDDLIISLEYQNAEFYILFGSSQLDNSLEIIHQSQSVNPRSIYTSEFDNLSYFSYGTPQLESFNFYQFVDHATWALAYVINENYNPNAAQQVSYFLGDINGDGHSEIILSNRTATPVLFEVFTTEYNGNAIDDEIITSPLHLTAYPNPFEKSLSLTYDLNEPGIIKLSVFNIKGQLVARIDEGYKSAGQNSVNWNGMDNIGRTLPSGVYLVKLSISDKHILCKKVTLCY
ncbi:MAG: FG-GAP-like repeat-containing protein [Candidatus Cloacimonetes bacterium]|jgi:hypothetical protein|nr:FG-GAP-like repeat-containing protein [Candidatus Cloacimonas sp.]MDD3733438.1 FG-GAP-like repeat-containing protein [Candidatus Cloacimonadota bacterium]HOQ77899.1 FG-GAP-like repeat-containing protein [Candidatus Cloacimonas sp.]HQB49869.1 FG-GAP-like repeat-containing protein [Candidatus Cloacimonas sp.]